MVYNCTIEKDGNMYIAQFPVMPNIVTGGFSRAEVLALAKDALDGCLESDLAKGVEIPAGTAIPALYQCSCPNFRKIYPRCQGHVQKSAKFTHVGRSAMAP